MGPGQSCRREGFYQGIEARSVHEGLRAHTGGADGRRTPLRPGPPNAGLRPDAPGPPSRRGRSWTLTAPDAELSEVNLILRLYERMSIHTLALPHQRDQATISKRAGGESRRNHRDA